MSEQPKPGQVWRDRESGAEVTVRQIVGESATYVGEAVIGACPLVDWDLHFEREGQPTSDHTERDWRRRFNAILAELHTRARPEGIMSEQDEYTPSGRTSNYGWALWHLEQAKIAQDTPTAQAHATLAQARATLALVIEQGAMHGVDPNAPTTWEGSSNV